VYVEGKLNTVSDALSRYFEEESRTELTPTEEYVDTDARLNPEGEDLPRSYMIDRPKRTIKPSRKVRESQEDETDGTNPANRLTPKPVKPTETPEPREIEAAELKRHHLLALDDGMVVEMQERESLSNLETGEKASIERSESPATLGKHVSKKLNIPEESEESQKQLVALPTFLGEISEATKRDKLLVKVLRDPEAFAGFSVADSIVYLLSNDGHKRLCIPGGNFKGRKMTEIVIDHFHSTLGHLGPLKTIESIKREFWWLKLSSNVEQFCASCGRCQVTKPSNQQPTGLLHSLPIPSIPWESISMDFLGPFPPVNGHDYLLVVLCRLTSMVHLLATNTSTSASEVAYLFYREVVRLHGLPNSIVSDRDSKFTSKFWTELHWIMGTKLLMSTAYHPQTDGATERTN
jgi:hypothetical protein